MPTTTGQSRLKRARRVHFVNVVRDDALRCVAKSVPVFAEYNDVDCGLLCACVHAWAGFGHLFSTCDPPTTKTTTTTAAIK